MDIRKLPPQYADRMKRVLGDAYDDYLASCRRPAFHGLRVNTLKISPEAFEQICPFALRKIPWIRGGYYVNREDGAGRHPFYYAGLYYLQEPSAMTPAQVLGVRPGERVLDLCAAPGGKSTALGAALRGEGLLVANDISASRCRALLKNIEVSGIANAVITNEIPARLAERFPAYFDRVLVDAPCSGEGMFRKDEAVVRAWTPEKNGECARIQKDIVVRAADMLREGGSLLYSTCTFSGEENEEVIAHLIRERPQMRLVPIPACDGSDGFEKGIGQAGALCVRIWPHRMEGEGHFLALLRKGGAADAAETSPPAVPYFQGSDRKAKAGRKTKGSRPGKSGVSHGRRGGRIPEQKDEKSVFSAFCRENRLVLPGYAEEKLYRRNDQLFMAALPEEELEGIRCIRNGLLLGEMKKDRFEPSQALAMALDGADSGMCLDLSPGDERLARYLKGESLLLTPEEENRAAAAESAAGRGRSDKRDETVRAGRANKENGPGQAGQADRTEQTDQAGQADRTEQTDQTDQAYRTEQTDQAGQADRTEQTDQTDQAYRTEQTDQAGQADRTEQTDQAGQADRTEQTDQTDQAYRTEQTGRTGRTGGSGWRMVTVGGFVLGWGKQTGSILKNKYLAGWRIK